MNRITQIEQLLAQSASEVVVRKTALESWGMSPRKFERALRKAKNRYARRGCAMDIIAELMITYDAVGHRLHLMAMEKDEAKKNASFHNTLRLHHQQRVAILKDIDHFRTAEDRNTFKDSERDAAREKELDHYKHVHFNSMDCEVRTGQYYDSDVGMTRNAFELNPTLLAQRDAARMRILPKSPREDSILAELLDAKLEPCDHFDPSTIDGTERPTDLGTLDPYEFSDFKYRKYSAGKEEIYRMARTIWLERLKHYNDTWCAAEKDITGVMDLFGIKLHVLHDSVGIPEPIKRALAGDVEAIADLKASVQAFRRGEIKRRKVDLPSPILKRQLDLNGDMYPLHRVEQVAREFYEKKDAAQKEALATQGYIPDELLAHPQFNIDVTKTGYRRDELLDTTLPKMPWDNAPPDDALSPRPFRPGAGASETPTPDTEHNNTPPSTLLKTATTITTALLLAFTLCWTMFTLTVGIHHLTQYMTHVTQTEGVPTDHEEGIDHPIATLSPRPVGPGAGTSECPLPPATAAYDTPLSLLLPAHAETTVTPLTHAMPPRDPAPSGRGLNSQRVFFLLFSSLFSNTS